MAGVRTTATVDNSHIREIPHRVAMQEARRIAQTPFGKAFSHFLAAFNAVVVSCSVDTVSACNIAWAKLNPLIPDNRDEQLSSIRGALYRLVQEPLHVKIEASFTAGHHFQDSVREIFEANFKTIFQCELHDHAQTLINANNRYAKQVQRTAEIESQLREARVPVIHTQHAHDMAASIVDATMADFDEPPTVTELFNQKDWEALAAALADGATPDLSVSDFDNFRPTEELVRYLELCAEHCDSRASQTVVQQLLSKKKIKPLMRACFGEAFMEGPQTLSEADCKSRFDTHAASIKIKSQTKVKKAAPAQLTAVQLLERQLKQQVKVLESEQAQLIADVKRMKSKVAIGNWRRFVSRIQASRAFSRRSALSVRVMQSGARTLATLAGTVTAKRTRQQQLTLAIQALETETDTLKDQAAVVHEEYDALKAEYDQIATQLSNTRKEKQALQHSRAEWIQRQTAADAVFEKLLADTEAQVAAEAKLSQLQGDVYAHRSVNHYMAQQLGRFVALAQHSVSTVQGLFTAFPNALDKDVLNSTLQPFLARLEAQQLLLSKQEIVAKTAPVSDASSGGTNGTS